MDNQQFKQLLQLAEDGETAAVLAAVDLDPALATRANEDGTALLHLACLYGHLELVTGLLDRGSDLHARNALGDDALFCASMNGHLPVATLLLDRGADPCTRDDNYTALGYAAAWGHHPVVLLLLSRGADLAATMTGRSNPVELKTALELCGSEADPPLSDEQKNRRREEMRAAFAAGPHPSQVLRRSIPGLQKQNQELQRVVRTFAALLFSEKHSDLVFVVKASGERIPAHKNLLSASSEHMAALLDGPWAENAAGVDGAGVPVTEVGVDESGVAVRALLRYIYTGEVDEAALATDLADVLGLASQHAQAGLVAACEEHAVKALKVARVVLVNDGARFTSWLSAMLVLVL